MMKPLLHATLLIFLLTVWVNVAGAEDAAAQTQTVKNITSSAVVGKENAGSSKTVVVGNKDSRRYHLPGMPYYNKVKKYHRVYFDSEEQAIANGYYKAGTPKNINNQAPIVAAQANAFTSKTVVIGNRDTRRYHTAGMPYYNKVKKYHRVYFDSEEQAIANGYYKAGTGRYLKGKMPAADQETVKTQTTPAATAAAAPEKRFKEDSQTKEEVLETRAQEAPKPVEEPQKPSGEKMQEPTVKKDTVAAAIVTPPSSPDPAAADPAAGHKVEMDRKDSTASAPRGAFLTREGAVLQSEKIVLSEARPRRLEASYTFDYLRPNDPYGNWHSGQFAFYHTLSPDFTYFVQGALLNRKEGTGGTGTVGAYKGWTSFLYTCTSVTAGSNSTFLPEFRFDHDFNFAVWPSKNINFLTGISYIDYFDDHRSLIFSGGPMITFEKWVLHYRLFYNISYPGTISSFSHLISLGYGEEGWQWTHLNVSFGKQAYLATYAAPQEVNQNSLTLNLKHRHWLGKHYGIFGDVSYTKLEDGYDRYGMGLGAFYEF